jgi:hypothetical protein
VRLSISQAAEHIYARTGVKLAHSTIVRWCATKKMNATKIGSRWFIEESELEQKKPGASDRDELLCNQKPETASFKEALI